MDGQSTTTRRRFLGTAAGATGVALGATVWGANQAAAATLPGEPTQRLQASVKGGFVSASFAIDIGQGVVGFLQDADGGHAYADVVADKLGADKVRHKHLAGVKYEDITVNAGAGMSKSFYEWIAASWNMQPAIMQRKTGAVIFGDLSGNATSERDFHNALITETTIPAMDGGAKGPAFLTVSFSPEYTQTKARSGKISAPPTTNAAQKWIASNFRLEIDGLDCSKVNKVDAFTVKQSIVTGAIGEGRDSQRDPGAVEFPSIGITFNTASSTSWEKWFDDFVIKGNNDQTKEKNGKLTFLMPNLQTELGTIKFFGMGIFKLNDDANEDVTSNIRRSRADLYVERMEFSMNGSVGEVVNTAPVIDAVTPSTTTPVTGNAMNLQVTAHDPDAGDTLTYLWSIASAPAGSAAALATPAAASTDLTPDKAGAYQLSIKVTDSHGAFASQSVTVNAEIPLAAQVAITDLTGGHFRLIADVSGGILTAKTTYRWSILTPPGSEAKPGSFDPPDAATTIFSASAYGGYDVALTVARGSQTTTVETLVQVTSLP